MFETFIEFFGSCGVPDTLRCAGGIANQSPRSLSLHPGGRIIRRYIFRSCIESNDFLADFGKHSGI